MFNVCLGLDWDQNTSTSMLNMDWIFKCPEQFIKRFIQGMADSDGTVRRHTVEIASMPNAEFVTTLLRKVGLGSAETIIENGHPMRIKVRIAEAIKIPMFNEIARSYRYVKLLRMYDDIVSKG